LAPLIPCASQVNSNGLPAVRVLAVAALIFGTSTTAALSASPAPTPRATPPAVAPSQQYDECLALVRTNPQRGYDQAMSWREVGGGFPADHCAAVALVELKRYPEAATRLQRLAGVMMQAEPGLRGGALEQAGNAWLLAGQPQPAKDDFDAALTFMPNDPDILIDRATANGLLHKFFESVDDLNRALEIAPNRADALIYRASAYRQLDSLDLALDDVEHALTIKPDAVTGLLERGNIRGMKGDVAGAKADWQRIIQLAPTSPEATAAKTNLARLDQAAPTPGNTPAKPDPAAKR
jgi:tetratricopeptide (TPR) repeat protein